MARKTQHPVALKLPPRGHRSSSSDARRVDGEGEAERLVSHFFLLTAPSSVPQRALMLIQVPRLLLLCNQ